MQQVTRGNFPVAYFSVKYSDVFCGKDLCVYSDNWYVRHKKEPVTSEMQEKIFLEPKENQIIVFSSNMTLLSLWALHGKLIVLKVRSAKSFSPIIIQCPCLFLSPVEILTTGDYARRRKYDSVTHSLYLAFLLTLFHPGIILSVQLNMMKYCQTRCFVMRNKIFDWKVVFF